MTTQPLYFGNEMDAFIPSDNTVAENTTAGTYDTAYTRCSIITLEGTTLKSLAFPSQTGDFYVNFCLYFRPNTNAENNLFHILNSGGTEVFRVTFAQYSSQASLVKMYYYNGSGFSQIGNGAAIGNSSYIYFTIYANRTTGKATLYAGGSQQDTGTTGGAWSSVTNFAQTVHTSQPFIHNSSPYWSQCFASVSPTLGQRLYTVVEDTNGANQDWTGSVTDINELVYNDGNGITSSTVNQISTYYKNGLSSTGVILGVGTSARFNIGATGPQNIQNVLRVSGTNYTSPSTLGTTGFAPAQYMWMTNPATSTAWTNSAANAVEWGVKSIT